MDLMLGAAKENPSRQFIFLTPLDMRSVYCNCCRSIVLVLHFPSTIKTQDLE